MSLPQVEASNDLPKVKASNDLPQVEASNDLSFAQVVKELEAKTNELEKAKARIAQLEQLLTDQVKVNPDMVEHQQEALQQCEEKKQRMEEQQLKNHDRVERAVEHVKHEATNVVIQELTEMTMKGEEIVDCEVTETDVKMACIITYKKTE